jgi:hypothetical protein
MPGGKDNPLLAGLSGDLAPMVSFVMPASHCQSPALGSADPSPAHAVPGLRGADQRVSRERLDDAGHGPAPRRLATAQIISICVCRMSLPRRLRRTDRRLSEAHLEETQVGGRICVVDMSLMKVPHEG